jgi:F-type H+-transporting ATPase subunit b
MQEQNEMNQQISVRIHKEVFSLTQKILTELSSKNLNEQLANYFLQQLQSMSEEDKLKLISAVSKTQQPLIVRSSDELANEIKDKFKKQLNPFGKNLIIQFEIDSSLLSGIEIVMTGFKISWNFRDYLQTIQADAKVRIDSILSQEAKVQQ